MAANFICHACKFERAMADKDIGKRGRCPKCGAVAEVVAAAPVAVVPVGSQAPARETTGPREATVPRDATLQAKARHDQTVLGEALRDDAIQAAPRHMAGASLPLPPPLPASAAPARKDWYYSYDGQRVGPLSETELRARIGDGSVRPTDEVWTDGMKSWRPADELFEFEVDDEPRPRRKRRRRRREDPNNGGMVCGILACIFGGVAFVFCPILMGLAGIVLGIVSVSISENKTIGIVGIAVSAVGMVVGMILGFLVMSAIGFGRF